MAKEQEAIEPEIVDEIPQQEKNSVKIGKNKKGLSWVLLTLAVIYILSRSGFSSDIGLVRRFFSRCISGYKFY